MLEEEHFSFYSLSSQIGYRRIKYIATLHDYLISIKNPASVLRKFTLQTTIWYFASLLLKSILSYVEPDHIFGGQI
jgi:hypothetical protein